MPSLPTPQVEGEEILLICVSVLHRNQDGRQWRMRDWHVELFTGGGEVGGGKRGNKKKYPKN